MRLMDLVLRIETLVALAQQGAIVVQRVVELVRAHRLTVPGEAGVLTAEEVESHLTRAIEEAAKQGDAAEQRIEDRHAGDGTGQT